MSVMIFIICVMMFHQVGDDFYHIHDDDHHAFVKDSLPYKSANRTTFLFNRPLRTSEFFFLKKNMSKWFKNSKNSNAQSSNTTSASSISSSLVAELDKLNLTEERLK